MSNEKNALSKEDKKLVNELFWNSFFLENCYNYERQQGLGFAVAMWPAIKRFYKTKEDRAEALTRHMAIFNTTPHVVGAITGVAAALESEASQNPEFDKSIINNVKVGLMGPFAGIGDSFFQGTLRIIASGIGISLCQQGSILGPLLFLLIFNVPHIIIRYLLTLVGYRSGTSLVEGARRCVVAQAKQGRHHRWPDGDRRHEREHDRTGHTAGGDAGGDDVRDAVVPRSDFPLAAAAAVCVAYVWLS